MRGPRPGRGMASAGDPVQIDRMARPKTRNLPDLSDLARPGARFELRVTPRAARDALSLQDGVLRVSVTAPPADGKANAAVRDLLARALGVAPSRLTLLRGQTARDKLFQLDG